MWQRPGRSGAVLYALAAALVGSIVAFFSRVQVERRRGNDRAARALPAGPVIIISNHTSHADGVLLVLACRRLGRDVRMLATSGVFRVPVLGGLLRRLGFISVQRDSEQAAAALDEAAAALDAGEAVGLYPEGRLTRDPMMWPERAKTGAVRLALRCDVPIVPVAMLGAHEVLGRRRRLATLARTLLRRPNPLGGKRLFTSAHVQDPGGRRGGLQQDSIPVRGLRLRRWQSSHSPRWGR